MARMKLCSRSWGHLLVGDVKMLSHGLGSGCHGDCLFKFAFRIQPEFSGNLSRTKQIQNILVLSSKDITLRSHHRPSIPPGAVTSHLSDQMTDSAYQVTASAKIQVSLPFSVPSRPWLGPSHLRVLRSHLFFLSVSYILDQAGDLPTSLYSLHWYHTCSWKT